MKKQWILGLLALSGMGCDVVLGIDLGIAKPKPAPKGECAQDIDCPVAEPECASATCIAGKCVAQYEPAGKLLSQQISGDCAQVVCDGHGATSVEIVDTDVPKDDGKICTKSVCIGKQPTYEPIVSDWVPCYTGPAGTNGIGACLGGSQKCENGQPIGVCQGEVVPQEESCVIDGDEDCDGQSNEDGAACVCAPKSVATCYTGPAGTENKGVCHGGMKTCLPTGLGYGPCENEVTPTPDTCDAAKTDQDCDGVVGCVGETVVVKTFASSFGGEPVFEHLASDASGNIVVAGWSLGTVELGDGSSQDCWHCLVKFDPSGKPLWIRHLSEAQITFGFDAEQNILLAGYSSYQGGLQWDNIVIAGDPSYGTSFVIKIDGATGQGVWGVGATNGYTQPRTIVAGANGRFFLLGTYDGAPEFGGAPLPAPNSNGDSFLLAFDLNGHPVWSKQLPAWAAQGVHIDSNDNVAINGFFSGTVTLAGSTYTAALGRDLFTGSFDGTGQFMSAKVFGLSLSNNGFAITNNSRNGRTWMAGYDNKPINLGGDALQPTTASDIFVAAFDKDQKHLFSKMYPGMGGEYATAIALNDTGRAAVLGGFIQELNVEGWMFPAKNDAQTLVVSYENDQSLRWARTFAADVNDVMAGNSLNSSALTMDPSGAIWVAGWFVGTADFGKGPVTSSMNGPVDTFLVKLAP